MKVLFRTWKDDGEVLALFPDIPADAHGITCTCYQHIGQHGAANLRRVVKYATVPATFAEALPLFRELEEIGYDDLEPVDEVDFDLARENRMEAIAKMEV